MDNEKKIKVVEIISPYQIILNCGLESGYSNGQKFLIYGLGKTIKDPDTGEDLETLEIVRGKGKIIHLQNKICTIESIEINETPTTITRKSPVGNTLSLLGMGPTEETQLRRDKMPFDEVQIGDLARPI